MKSQTPWDQMIEDIRQGKNIELYVTIFAAVFVAVLSMLNVVDTQIVLTAVLAVLSLVAFSLLTDRTTTKRIRTVLEEVKRHIDQPELKAIFFSWRDSRSDLRSRLKQSREVCIVIRSGINFWNEYSNELLEVAHRGGVVRVLMIDPDGDAFQNHMQRDFSTADMHDPSLFKANVCHLLGVMRMQAKKLEHGKLEVHVIDYVAPLALVSTTLQDGSEIIQVGMGTVLDARVRPSFTITRADGENWFTWFTQEFEVLWSRSRPAYDQTQPT